MVDPAVYEEMLVLLSPSNNNHDEHSKLELEVRIASISAKLASVNEKIRAIAMKDDGAAAVEAILSVLQRTTKLQRKSEHPNQSHSDSVNNNNNQHQHQHQHCQSEPRYYD